MQIPPEIPAMIPLSPTPHSRLRAESHSCAHASLPHVSSPRPDRRGDALQLITTRSSAATADAVPALQGQRYY